MHWQRYLEDPVLESFVACEAGGARVLVRRGYEDDLVRLGMIGPPARANRMVGGGREPHPLVQLADGGEALVRRYLRGGAVRHLVRARYFVGHRAFDELRATERAHRSGVGVPLPIAAAERRHAIGYSAWLATRWIPGATDLHHWLLAHEPAQRLAALGAAGREIARMHAAGIAHPDLNLRNLLAVGDAPAALYLLDFDRARLHDGAVPAERRERDLLRLMRSARKLGAPIPEAGWEAMRAGYGPGWPLRRPRG